MFILGDILSEDLTSFIEFMENQYRRSKYCVLNVYITAPVIARYWRLGSDWWYQNENNAIRKNPSDEIIDPLVIFFTLHLLG